ncbi:MAG TPA: hypothetical protein VNT75_16390 [Symbiobacteriaceae bacterium]|nr:hypothetical protein [Symbiobacteriaceae bacterium]
MGLFSALMLVLAACSGKPESQTTSDSTSPSHLAEPVSTSTGSQPGSPEEPLSCAGTDKPTEEAMFRLLVELTRYAPLDFLVGDARAYELQRLALDEMAWPPTPDDWTGLPWKELAIKSDTEGRFRVSIAYDVPAKYGVGVPYTSEMDFQVLCADGHWRVAKTGGPTSWAVLPSGVPGQQGELTPELAALLAYEAFTRGGVWLVPVATGHELESGRIADIKRATGWFRKIQAPWPNIRGNPIQITRQDDTHALGEWSNKNGAPSGEFVRFEKIGGMWKVENHTYQGVWLPDGKVGFSPVDDDQEIFHLTLGLDRAAVESRVGVPDERESTETGTVYHYNLRQLDVSFDRGDKVTAVSIAAGSTFQGIKVGAPISMVEALWGPKPDNTYPFGDGNRLLFSVQDGRISRITMEHGLASNAK